MVRDRRYVLGRVLEHGRLDDVLWAVRHYGPEVVHEFFEKGGHPELSPRTLSFWRAVFMEKSKTWETPHTWRKNSCAPWID